MKDTRQRLDGRELVERLGPRDGHEGNRHEHAHRRHLFVAIFDAVEVKD